MPRKQPELGTKSPFRLRLGIDIDRFRGVNKESDPGAIQDTEFQELRNVRLLPSGAVAARKGQEALNTSAVTGCVTGIFDDEDVIGTNKLYYTQISGGTDLLRTINTHDTIASLHSGDELNSEYRRCLADFDGVLISSKEDSDDLYSVNPSTGAYTHIADLSGDNFTADFAHFDGQLWIVVEAGLSDKVYSWDGTNITLDDSLDGPVGTFGARIASYKPYGGTADLFYSSDHSVRKRNGGSWDAVALPGGLTAFEAGDMVPYAGKLYLLGLDNTGSNAAAILAYNGSAISLVNSPTGGRWVMSAAEFNGFLYYAWIREADDDMMIGRYDGMFWDDDYKNLTDDIASTNNASAYRMVYWRDDLYICSSAGLLRSPGLDVSGTWTRLDSTATGDAHRFDTAA